MNPNQLIRRVVIASGALGALVAALLWLYYDWQAAVSSAVGTALGAANFALLARLAVTMLDDSNPHRRRAGILLGVKFVALVTIVGVLIVHHLVRGGALMAGISAVVAAITIVALFNGSGPDTKDSSESAPKPKS
jgi:hypothetical protein